MLLTENNHHSLKNDQQKQSLQYLKGVGPVRAERLKRLGLETTADVIQYYPRNWEDRRIRYQLTQLPLGEKVCLKGIVQDFIVRRTGAPLSIGQARLVDSQSNTISLVWFKQITPRYDPYESLKNHFSKSPEIFVYGQTEQVGGRLQLKVEDWGLVQEPTSDFHFNRITPIYPATQGLSDKFIRQLLGLLILQQTHQSESIIPTSASLKNNSLTHTQAVRQIHFPDNWSSLQQARELLAYEEALVLETALLRLRSIVQRHLRNTSYSLQKTLLTPFREQLPFELTSAQKKVIHEIFDHLQKPHCMTRLLQGDVGSGKTVVSLCAMLLAAESGGQSVLMAPTEILAEQHLRTIQRLLGSLPVRISLFTGRLPKKQRTDILKQLQNGSIQILIGTHALLEEDVRFKNLLFAAIDEQHRFGVKHRTLLRSKGKSVDLLVMTATPIPRTLAMTTYGDLDVSTIDQRPPGRIPIRTYHVPEQQALDAVLKAVQKKQQAFIVYPLVEESEFLDIKAVHQEAQRLAHGIFSRFKVGTLTGPMKSTEKDKIMTAFRDGEIDILIASSIVEVGIDVPNATHMVIQHAERFGLATLHQLRGRIGRGPLPSTCYLVANARSAEAKARIQILTETNDGFKLSEEDLRLRGPGEVLGVHQHGLPLLKLLNLSHDHLIIQSARNHAEQLLNKDPDLQNTDHQNLRRAIKENYDSKWQLGLSG